MAKSITRCGKTPGVWRPGQVMCIWMDKVILTAYQPNRRRQVTGQLLGLAAILIEHVPIAKSSACWAAATSVQKISQSRVQFSPTFVFEAVDRPPKKWTTELSTPRRIQGEQPWNIDRKTRTLRCVIVWQRPVTVEGDTNLTALLRLELLPVGLDSVCMCDDNGVCDTVRSCRKRAHEHIVRPEIARSKATESSATCTQC